MNIEYSLSGNTLFIRLLGELDEYTAGYTRTILDDMLIKHSYDNVVFDLAKLDFMDSTGIGVMLGRYKRLQSRNIPIYIINPSRQAEKIFQMAGLYDIMPKIS